MQWLFKTCLLSQFWDLAFCCVFDVLFLEVGMFSVLSFCSEKHHRLLVCSDLVSFCSSFGFSLALIFG